MARYAVVVGGVCTNVIEADEAFAAQYAGQLVQSSTASPGDTFADNVFTPPAPPPVPVPEAVTMRQARLALLGAGLLDNVTTAINALPSPLKEAAQIEWEYSNEVQRYNGFVEQLAPALSLTEGQLDDLFRAAATL